MVLVVDDDEDIRESIRDVLESQGYRVRTAADGFEALDVLVEERPSLVLLEASVPS